MQVWKVDLSISIDVLPSPDHHSIGGLDEADRWIVRISVQQPQADRNVVNVS